jgi:hypothetical protein
LAFLREEDDNNESSAQGMNQNAPEDSGQPRLSGMSAMSSPGGDASSTSSNAPTGGGAAPRQTTKPASSGMGASFKDYMRANQGAATQRLGQTVQNRVTGAASGASNTVQGAQNQFGTQLEQGTLANRQQAVGDVSRATQQAQNIYKGNIAADTAAYQQKLASAQADIANTNQFKIDEAARIAEESKRVDAEKNTYYNQILAERKKALEEAQTRMYESSGSRGARRGLKEASAAYRNAQSDAQKQFQSQYDKIAQDQNVLNTQDTRLSGLQSQVERYNQQLAMLANPNLIQAIDPTVQQRFGEVINAQYTGPQSLRQAGLYDLALGNVNRAQDMLGQSKTAGGRQDLLNAMYGVQGQQYGRGVSGLDAAFLNTNQGAVQNILNKGQEIGSLRGTLDRALIGSENAARNRTQEIKDIVNQARGVFTEGQTATSASTEAAIDQRQKDAQDFLAQLRSGFSADNRGTQTLSAAEAAILGLQEGEGLYNLGENVVQQRALDRDRLISRDEQARLAALSTLAGMDERRLLSTNNLYQDASRAGTQTATDILDRDAVRQSLANAEQAFRDYAKGANISATGYGTGTSGGAFGTKRASAYRTLNAGLQNVLDRAGYDSTSEINRETLGSNDVVQNIVNALDYNRPISNQAQTPDATAVQNSSDGVTDVSQPGLNLSQALLAPHVFSSDFYRDLGAELRFIPGANIVGNFAGNVLDAIPGISDLGNFVSGGISGSSGKAKAKAAASAAADAQRRLRENIQSTLTNQGYYNRTDINPQDIASMERAAALLRRIG